MNNTLVLATRNKGKTREIQNILKDYPVIIKNLDDFGPIPEVVEDGETFDDNAYKKSSFTSRVLGLPALADDSGLIVDALNGEPGIRSARYASDNATDQENLEKVLTMLKDKDNRKASFKCVLSLAIPTGAALTYEATCEGQILSKPQGSNGFGYDPVFYYPEFKKTFAQLTIEEKAQVSHRGKALKELGSEFAKVLDWIDIHMP